MAGQRRETRSIGIGRLFGMVLIVGSGGGGAARAESWSLQPGSPAAVTDEAELTPAAQPFGPVQAAAVPIGAPAPRSRSFGAEVGAVKWEAGALFAYMTATQIAVTKKTEGFHFQDEGWFGKDTTNLGVDKLTHAYNSYLIAEFLQSRIARKTGVKGSGAVTAAVLASGLMIYSELYDAHKVTSGFSIQDVLFNTGGAAFSVARNTVPGLEQKLDFRLLLIPNSDIYTFKGKRHYAQQRFMLALKLSGFEGMERSPLRFLELHAGYHASGFTGPDRARGETPRRRIFYGVGVNLKELFFKSPRSTAGRIAGQALDYLQVPYTAIHIE